MLNEPIEIQSPAFFLLLTKYLDRNILFKIEPHSKKCILLIEIGIETHRILNADESDMDRSHW